MNQNQTQIQHETIVVGTRVEAGTGEGHDTGTVLSIEGDVALVAWDGGACKAECSIDSLTAL